MQAYYEMNIEVPQNHLVSFYLPETIPAGQVKIAGLSKEMILQ
jgi:hypothetical protein